MQAGTPLSVLQELGGWESSEMVRKYAHLSAGHLAKYSETIAQPHAVCVPVLQKPEGVTLLRPGHDTNLAQPPGFCVTEDV